MQEINKYPEFFARFYDTIYHQLRDTTDHNFFSRKINECHGKVLEIGVGTGRFFVESLHANADIYGIDISPAMLDICKTKIPEKEQNRLSLQDMRTFSFDMKFDLIIAPFRVFMHILNNKEQLIALNNVADHLSENGIFIFDAYVPNMKMMAEGLDNDVDFIGEYESGKKLKRLVSMKTDLIEQINEMFFTLEWDEDNQVKQEFWITKLKYFFRHEIEYLIEKSGLKLEHFYGDYNETPLNSTSNEFVLVCSKK